MKITDEIAEDSHEGVSGFFVTWRGWDAIELDHEREIGRWRLQVGRLKVDVDLKTTELVALRKNAAIVQWRATYGPWLGLAGGLTIGIVVAAIVAAVKVAFPQLQVQR